MTLHALHIRRERGTALLETALTLPLLLLITVGIFEFGRAFQTWQVLTNAAREGARVAVLPGALSESAGARVAKYLADGQIPNADLATVSVKAVKIDLGGGLLADGSQITVTYPYEFAVLQPIAQLVVHRSTVGEAFPMTAVAVMRNE